MSHLGRWMRLRAKRLNVELLDIWTRTKTTIVFVTHSIPEAVFLSTWVVVMQRAPGADYAGDSDGFAATVE